MANSTPVSTMTISSEEINLLIHSYLLDCGFVHSAYAICQEGRLQKSTKFKKHIPRGELVALLSKSLLYMEVEAHYRGDEQVGPCRTPFSLLEAHVCSSNPSAPGPYEISIPHSTSVIKSFSQLSTTITSTSAASSVSGALKPVPAAKRKVSPAPTINDNLPEKRAKTATGDSKKITTNGTTTSPMQSPNPDINDKIRQGHFRRALKGHDGEIFVSFWHPIDHHIIASGAKNATLKIWTLPDDFNNLAIEPKSVTLTFDNKEKSTLDVTSLHWNRDGTMLAIGSYDAILRVVNQEGQQQALWTHHNGPIFTVRFSPNGRYIISASLDGATCLFDMKENKLLRRYKVHKDCVLDCVWINDTQFATCGADAIIFVMDIHHDAPVKAFTGHVNEINQIRPNAAATHLASGSDDKTARIWNLTTLAVDDLIPGLAASSSHPVILSGHEHAVTGVAWCEAEGRSPLIATSSFDTTARLWDAESGQCLRVMRDFTKPLYVLAAAPNAKWIAAAGADGSLRVYSTEDETKQWHWNVPHDRPGIFELDWKSWNDGDIQRLALSLECHEVMVFDTKAIEDTFK